jgi:hypothetical protein
VWGRRAADRRHRPRVVDPIRPPAALREEAGDRRLSWQQRPTRRPSRKCATASFSAPAAAGRMDGPAASMRAPCLPQKCRFGRRCGDTEVGWESEQRSETSVEWFRPELASAGRSAAACSGGLPLPSENRQSATTEDYYQRDDHYHLRRDRASCRCLSQVHRQYRCLCKFIIIKLHKRRYIRVKKI